MRWAGHVACMEKRERIPAFGREREEPLGRSRGRWEDTIKKIK
jgi:hypothetical protein